MVREVTRLLKALSDGVTLSTLEDSVSRHSYTVAIDAFKLRFDPDRIVELLQTTVTRAGAREARSSEVIVKETARLSYAFDLADPRAIAWAEQHAGELIVQIDQGTRDAIRALIVRALSEGGHPITVARQIKPLIGLHSRWATAVLNKQFAMQAAGVPPATVERTIAAYYQRLLSARSKNIARTEILKAANAGKALAWTQAYEKGLLGDRPTKVWQAASDAEPVCAAVDGMEVPLNGEFSTSLGNFEMPPAHPSCRCTASISNVGHGARPQQPTQPQPSTPSTPSGPTSEMVAPQGPRAAFTDVDEVPRAFKVMKTPANQKVSADMLDVMRPYPQGGPLSDKFETILKQVQRASRAMDDTKSWWRDYTARSAFRQELENIGVRGASTTNVDVLRATQFRVTKLSQAALDAGGAPERIVAWTTRFADTSYGGQRAVAYDYQAALRMFGSEVKPVVIRTEDIVADLRVLGQDVRGGILRSEDVIQVSDDVARVLVEDPGVAGKFLKVGEFTEYGPVERVAPKFTTADDAAEWFQGYMRSERGKDVFVDFHGWDTRSAQDFVESMVKMADDGYGAVLDQTEYFGSLQSVMKQRVLDKLKALYPQRDEEYLLRMLKGRIKRIGDGTYATAGYDGGDVTAATARPWIGVNDSFAKNVERWMSEFKADVRGGYHPEGMEWGNAMQGTIVHEFGHTVQFFGESTTTDVLTYPGVTSGPRRSLFDLVEDAIRQATSAPNQYGQVVPYNRDIVAEGLSRYGTQNKYEFFAEAWAEYKLSPNPREIARIVGEAFDEVFRMWAA